MTRGCNHVLHLMCTPKMRHRLKYIVMINVINVINLIDLSGDIGGVVTDQTLIGYIDGVDENGWNHIGC